MKPVSMPTVSFKTFATGARQLVVQEPLETTRWSLVSLSWLTPNTMVASAPSDGAETSTRLAPAVRCAEALALALKMPVHSSAMSTPSSFHGSVEGSRTAVTLILPLPRLIESPSTVTVPGNRPCTESKRSRWALVSTGPRSLIPTTSMSLRPDSAMARSTLRPIRPNPLIATRTAMLVSPLIADAGPADLRPRSFLRRIARFGRARTDYMRGYLVPFAGKLNRNGPSTQALQGSVNRGLSGNSEVLEKVLRRGTGPETVHAHEFTVGSDHGVPAPAHRGFDRDLDRGVADDGLAAVGGLRQQQFQRGHRDHPRRDAALGELLLGRHRNLDLGARGEQRNFCIALGRDQLVAALRAGVVGRRGGAELRQVLAGQRQHRRAVDPVQRQFPALGDLDGIAGPEHAHVGHGAQCREVLDRLVGRAVFAEPDRIMGH